MTEKGFENLEVDSLDESFVNEMSHLLKVGKEKEYLTKLDKFLLTVEIKDCGERMMSLKDVLPEDIFIDLVDLKVEIGGLDRLKLREGVIDRLIQAQKSLPKGMHLVIRDAFRSKAVVESLYKRYIALIIERDNITENEADIKVRALLAMPDDVVPPGHMTGGAVDVILAYDDKSRVPMEISEDLISRDKQTWTNCEGLPEEIKNNRLILLNAMADAGFHNYAREYWHYSYGEAYWAVRRKNKTAIYGIPN